MENTKNYLPTFEDTAAKSYKLLSDNGPESYETKSGLELQAGNGFAILALAIAINNLYEHLKSKI